MDKNYKINQDGKIYFLSSEIVNDKIKLICKSMNPPSTNTYLGEFSLSNLQKHCEEFRYCSNIIEAQKLINDSIEKNKFIVRNNINNIDLQLFLENNKSPLNFDLVQNNSNNNNNIIPSQVNNQHKSNIYYPKKRIIRDYLSLYLAPKEKNNSNFNSPLKNDNNINKNYSPSYTNTTSPFSSPLSEKVNISNSPSKNEIIIPDEKPNLDTMKKLNNLVNENIILKNQIIDLNKQLNELYLTNQKFSNNLQNLKSQTDSMLNQQQEVEDLKTINEQLNNENIDLKNKLFQTNINDSYIIRGDIIKNQKELEFLTQKISQNYKSLTLNLIYKASVDSDKAEVFHYKCNLAQNSLVLVETDKNARFGGFTTCNWGGNCELKMDKNAFVFSLNKFKIYDIIPGEKAIGCFPKYGPIFLGCQIVIYDNAFIHGGSTYLRGANYKTEEDFELAGGEQTFRIKDIEVYSIILE